MASTLFARAGGIKVLPGEYYKRSGLFMMIAVGVRVEMDARYLSGVCLGSLEGRQAPPVV